VKREAVVCDLLVWHKKPCLHLADYVCPLCQRDACAEHRVTRVNVRIQAVWPQRPQSSGMALKDDPAAVSEAEIDICTECFTALESTKTPSSKALSGKILSLAVEAYGADLAAAKLAKDTDGSD
jgi:hypothetical protein